MSPDAVTIHDLQGDANPYAYVHGTPLMGVDPDGNFAQMAIGAIVSTVTQLAVNGTVDWKEVAISAAVGAITGGVALGSGVMAGAASGMVGNAANSILHGESISAKGLATGALSGGVSGGISGIGGQNPNAATSIGLGSVGSAAGYVAVSGATGQKMSAKGLGMAAASGAVAVGVAAAYSAINSSGQAARTAVGSGKEKAQEGDGPDMAASPNGPGAPPAETRAPNDDLPYDAADKASARRSAVGKTIADAHMSSGPAQERTQTAKPRATPSSPPRPTGRGIQLCGEPPCFPRGGIGPVLKGQAGVERAIGDLSARGYTIVGREITLDMNGVRTRPDLLVRTPEGGLEFVEVKNGPGAGLTSNQAKAFPAISLGGAVPSGANAAAAGLTPGVPLPPIPVRVIQY